MNWTKNAKYGTSTLSPGMSASPSEPLRLSGCVSLSRAVI